MELYVQMEVLVNHMGGVEDTVVNVFVDLLENTVMVNNLFIFLNL